MNPTQRVEERFGDDGEPAELHQAVERRAHRAQRIDALRAHVEANALGRVGAAFGSHFGNGNRGGLPVRLDDVALGGPVRQRKRRRGQLPFSRRGRRQRIEKCRGEVEVFDADEIVRSRQGDAHGRVLGLAELVRRYGVELAVRAREHLRRRHPATLHQCGVAEAAAPGDAVRHGPAVDGDGRLNIGDVARVEMEMLADLKVAVAPDEGQIGGRFQRAVRGRRADLVEAGVRRGLLIAIAERNRERPAVDRLGDSCVHHVERTRGIVAVGVLAKLPAAHCGAAIRNLHVVERALDYHGLFGSCRDGVGGLG